MINSIHFTLSLLLIVCSIHGQGQILSGRILNADTKQPIPYANIGIPNTEAGTISNEDGTFSLTIPTTYQDKDIIFYSVGYIRKSVPISSISNFSNILIYLDEETLKLDIVTIFANEEKEKSAQFGNGKSLLLSGQLHFDSLSAGGAMALLIDKRGDENLTFLQDAALYIAKNLSPEFKVRLRIMSVDSMTNQPGTDLIQEQYLQVSSIKKGWLNFKITTPFQIKENQFYLVFEWIMDENDRKYVARKYAEYKTMYPDRVSYDTILINNEKVSIPQISTVVAGTVFGVTHSKRDIENFTCYFRSNSFGEWKRSSGILSAKATLSNYPVMDQEITGTHPCDDQDIQCHLNLWAQMIRDKYNLPGLQLSIGKQQNIIFSEGYGYSDLDADLKVTRQSQFRIASVSKTMTSAAIMQLFSQGLLHPDSAIQIYVPDFPEKKYPITVRQLAAHLGGVRDYYEKSWDEIFIQDHYDNLSEALNLFKDDPLAVKPGTQFLYSSYGYILLGAAIENISGQPYLSFMKEHIWNPLEMDFTYGDVADSLMKNKSKFYFLSGEEATPYDLSYSYSTGGLVSTCDDLVKFGFGIMNNELLDKSTRNELFKDQQTSFNQATGYGLGWYLQQDKNGNTVWFHTGELPSSSSLLIMYPEKKLVIAFLSNAPVVSETESDFLMDVQQLADSLLSK